MSKLAQTVARLVAELHQTFTAPSRDAAKASKKTHESARISAVRKAVFVADPACICGSCRPSVTDHMHELLARSQTRGRPPEERFSLENCVRVSGRCHEMITGPVGGKRLRVVVLAPELGANGTLQLRWKDGQVATYRRLPKRLALAREML